MIVLELMSKLVMFISEIRQQDIRNMVDYNI